MPEKLAGGNFSLAIKSAEKSTIQTWTNSILMPIFQVTVFLHLFWMKTFADSRQRFFYELDALPAT